MDSLRAAALLKLEGYNVFGVHMHITPDSVGDGNFGPSDGQDREAGLRALASRLDIPIEFVDLRDSFEKTVILPFLEAYRSGLTPNPCVVCNPRVKFGILMDEARRLGADRLATGHYVRLTRPDSSSARFRLHRAVDSGKDQSYFLYGLAQEQLAHALFPLGGTTKLEVLKWAREAGFGSLVPEESQEICFIPSGDYRRFLQERLGLPGSSAAGNIVDMDGSIVGKHQGIFSYTVGQRRGLGIASSAPYYVVRLDPASNTVQVGRNRDLFRSGFNVDGVNWVSIAPPGDPVRCRVRIRNQHNPAAAWVTPAGEREVSVRFDEPQRAVTPGQAAVFYRDGLLLGGGAIKKE